MAKKDMKASGVLAQAVEYAKSQGFHLMTKDDIPRFADCAAEAYENASYPLTNYFVGHPCTKEELRTMWLFNLNCTFGKSLVYSDSPQGDAWLMWIPPGFQGFPIKDSILHGGIKMVFQLGMSSMRRILHYEDYALSLRMGTTAGREWYLYNAAVRPEAQGKHLFGKLLTPMLDFFDRCGKPVFLETHAEKNVGRYKHFGFEVVSDAPLPGTELPHWGMVKPSTYQRETDEVLMGKVK